MILPFQDEVVNAWAAFGRGECDAAAVKSVSSYFGIYPQRNDKAMMRLRRTAGVVTPADLINAARILKTHHGDFAHLTTRQCIQLHSIPPAEVPAALNDCEDVGFHFRGGGGDTFRNVLVNDHAGLWVDTIFDVRPYAFSLAYNFYSFELAYHLPRKLKVSFADRIEDAYIAKDQDLGFLAKMVDGAPCFEVYMAGGIGIRPRTGIKIFDALPAADCVKVAMALTAFFNDRGCRTNRGKARIRHLRTEMGDEAFVQTFMEYYAKAPDVKANPGRYIPREINPCFPAGTEVPVPPETWKALAVTKLKDNLCAVRVFVPFGNFTAEELRHFGEVMEKYGVKEFAMPVTQDLSIVVPEEQLGGIYQVLKDEFPGRGYTMETFVGNIRTCIGCTICKSGVTDSPAIGRKVGEYFDKYLPLDTPEKLAIAKALLNDVRISGCPNSCTCQVLAKFGFSGRKVNGADGESVYTPGSVAGGEVVLGTMDAAAGGIAADDFPAFLEQRVLSSLH